MYCRNCAYQIPDNAEFCISCGQRPLLGTRFCQACGKEGAPGADVVSIVGPACNGWGKRIG